jgi:hypothetical protein
MPTIIAATAAALPPRVKRTQQLRNKDFYIFIRFRRFTLSTGLLGSHQSLAGLVT